MKILYIDPVGGLAGDMLCAALLDLGLDSEIWLKALGDLNIDNWRATIWKEQRSSFMATRLKFEPNVIHNSNESAISIEPWDADHRHYQDIVTLIEDSQLSNHVKKNVLDIFKVLAAAEAKIHGCDIKSVHFHEVGAVDSILDIVGFCIGLELLEIEKIYNASIPVSEGSIQGAHGHIPLPAPATLELLKGRQLRKGVKGFEQVTPTGAAIISALSEDAAFPEMSLTDVGYGAGSRNPKEFPNLTRLIIGMTEASQSNEESIIEIKTQIDDMTGEETPRLLELLLNAGAVDVFFQSITMKKGRPGHLFTILCHPINIDAISAVLFKHSSTFGLRWQSMERIILKRHWESVTTPWGLVRVKVGKYKGKIMTRSPEYEDVVKCAQNNGISLKTVMNSALADGER